MKKVLFAVACLLCLAACGTKEPDNQSLAVGSPDINFKTDLAANGFLGKVHHVRYKKGGEGDIRFFEDGNLRNSPNVNTHFRERMRSDFRPGKGTAWSYFDELGRLAKFELKDSSITYKYDKNAYYPSSKTTVIKDSLGWKRERKVTYTYDKKDFDEHGNWLRRTENGDTVIRTIRYYPDPYEVTVKDLYKSPKEVAKAFYEGEIARDANKALSTYPHIVRVKSRMTVKDREAIYAAQEADKSNIEHFSIKGTEKFNENGRQGVAVKTKIRYQNGRKTTQTIHCFQGKDKNWYRDKFTMEE